jgi:hypothetical protein
MNESPSSIGGYLCGTVVVSRFASAQYTVSYPHCSTCPLQNHACTVSRKYSKMTMSGKIVKVLAIDC